MRIIKIPAFIPIIFLLLLLPGAFSTAQIELVKEEISGQQYRLTFVNRGYAYHVDSRSKTVVFQGMTDESRPALPVSPQREIFIALPPGSQPAAALSIVRSSVIDGVQLHRSPVARRLNDTIVVYDEVGSNRPAASPDDGPWYTVNGYLWLGNSYCLHVTVHPYADVRRPLQVRTIDEFTVTLDVPEAVAAPVPAVSDPLHPLIDNTRMGPGWTASAPSHAVPATDSWIDYSADYVKLGVVRDAVHRIRYSDLQNYGVPVATIDPAALKLYYRGKEWPIYVRGQADGKFDTTDFIEFLGRRNYGDVRYREVPPIGGSYYEFLDRYSDTTIYWLRWTGAPGKRADTSSVVTVAPTDTLKFFDHLAHAEVNAYWDFQLNPSPSGLVRRELPELLENETWNDRKIGVGKTDIVLGVVRLFPNRPARAFVKLQNYASSIDVNAHLMALKINSGTATYDSGYLNKYEQKVLRASFNSNLLTQGTSTINIHSFPTANTTNTVISDWYELEYPRYIATTTDSLIFGYRSPLVAGAYRLVMTGLSAQPVTVYRFNTLDSTSRKIGVYQRSGDSLVFNDSVRDGIIYYLIAESKVTRPLFFAKKKFVNLRSQSRSAQYIAITHPYFMTTAQNYVSFIAGQYGVTTSLVDINDIYDEFNYGYFSPEPIRDFLKSAAELWQPPRPQYLLLIGKATYDFYGNKTRNFGTPRLENFVPSYGNPVSDYWFVMWDTTKVNIPMMSVGRIPAKSLDEFNEYFLRHQKYVSKGSDDWNKRYISFSGGSSASESETAQSKNANEAVLNNYVRPRPVGGNAVSFYKTVVPQTNFGPYTAEFVKQTVEQGSVFISYIGHSGTQTWDNSIADVTQLSNIRDRNPLVTDFGCSTVKHAEPDVLSFSEIFVVDPKGQAISYIGNSSLGFASTAYSFPSYFYRSLLTDTAVSIGTSHMQAKVEFLKNFGSTGSYRLFSLTNTIIGDPIVRLPIPDRPNLSVSNSVMLLSNDRPTELDDSLIFRLPYLNLGRAPSDSITIQYTSEYKGALTNSATVRRIIPLYGDTLRFSAPVGSRPGQHRLTVVFDPQNTTQELNETDNTYSVDVFVASSSIRSISLLSDAEQSDGRVKFLNPSLSPGTDRFTVTVSDRADLAAPVTSTVVMDSFLTTFTLPAQFAGKRIWYKPTFDSVTGTGLTHSAFFGDRNNVLLADPHVFNRMSFQGAKVQQSGIALDTSLITFGAISAGANAGATAVVTRNGLNLTPSSNLTGHHVGVFDTVKYEMVYFNRFIVSAGGVNITDYEKLLDTLSGRFLLVVAVCNDGYSNLTTKIRTSYKQFGSVYIDSLTNLYSWAFIGRKGATKSMVKERFSRAIGNIGRVQVDTVFRLPNDSGSFASERYGPAAAWGALRSKYTANGGSSIRLGIIGSRSSGQVDTLRQPLPIDTLTALSMVDPAVHPYIKFFGTLTAGAGDISPVLTSLAVDLNGYPELGTNYQVFSAHRAGNGGQQSEIAAADTVMQGTMVQFRYKIYNAGMSTARTIKYTLRSVWDNNSVEIIDTGILDSIPAEGYRELMATYSTSLGSGRRTIHLSIDPDSTVREIYRDNNVYTFPFVVKKSSGNPLLPNLAITKNAVTSFPAQITDETDTARFTIVYGNTGALVNDSISILIKHLYQSATLREYHLRRKYPVSYDTIRIDVPVGKRGGAHQLSVELDNTGLILESSESDNLYDHYFTVVTTEFKVLFPISTSIGFVDRIIFLNPTAGSALSTPVTLQLDTVAAFSAPLTVNAVMQQFSTAIPLPNLKRSQRYFWRVKSTGGTQDWSTGSFYSGDTSVSAIGQLDSVGWSANRFVRAAFQPDSGARIIDSRFTISASSAGFSDGNTGAVLVNGVNIITPILGSGHHVIVLDTADYQPTLLRRFDLAADAAQADSLTQFIAAIPNGRIVIDVVVDEGSNNLQPATRTALKSIGSAFIDQLAFRDSWTIIGRKGAAAGTVPEMRKAQGSGAAAAEMTVVRLERSGSIETPLIGPFTTLGDLKLNSTVPPGAQLTVKFIGVAPNGSYDTLVSVTNQPTVPLSSIDTRKYTNGKLLLIFTAPPLPAAFRAARRSAVSGSPAVKGWSIAAAAGIELALSSASSTIDRSQVMEGESITFTGTVYNVSAASADSVVVQLKSTSAGIDQVLKQQRYLSIPAGDSIRFTYELNTRNRAGNHAFTFEIDPLDSLAEQTRENNSVSVPYVVTADSLRPTIQVTFDGLPVLNGDLIAARPVVLMRYTDNNPSAILPADTSNFIIKLNNKAVPFIDGTAQLLPSSTAGRADVRWTPELPGGENIISLSARDISGNGSDTLVLYLNTASQLGLLDVFNIPNPFHSTTTFTFTIASPSTPDEVTINIYTVAGRMIRQFTAPGIIGFNKVHWDGRDNDGDELGNGVYFYKVTVKQGGTQVEGISKLVKMR